MHIALYFYPSQLLVIHEIIFPEKLYFLLRGATVSLYQDQVSDLV